MADDTVPGQFIYSWRIKNFSMDTLDKNEFMCSPWILAESLERTKWRFQFYPRGKQAFEFPCFLYRAKDDEGPDKITISGDIGIVDVNGVFRKSEDPFRRRAMEKGDNEGTGKFMYRREMFENSDLFLPNDILTIQCRLRSHCAKRCTVTKCSAVTDIMLDKCLFRWNIRQFDLYKTNKKLKIPLPLTSNLEAGFYLSSNSEDGGWAKIVVCNNENKNISVKLVASLLNVNGTPTEFETVKGLSTSNGVLESKLLMPKKKLFEERTSFENDGILTLVCEVIIADGKTEARVESLCSQDVPIDEVPIKTTSDSDLRKDLQALYLERKFSDIQLKADGNIFPAHKSVLAARSPVFQAMFEQDMVESRSGVVEIVDVDSSTLNNLLLYMYSDILENLNYEAVLKLYTAADKYQVMKLKHECAVLLKTKLSVENVCEILSFADLHKNQELKAKAERYIITNTNGVLLSEEWKIFVKRNPSLASEAVLLVSKNIEQNQKFFM